MRPFVGLTIIGIIDVIVVRALIIIPSLAIIVFSRIVIQIVDVAVSCRNGWISAHGPSVGIGRGGHAFAPWHDRTGATYHRPRAGVNALTAAPIPLIVSPFALQDRGTLSPPRSTNVTYRMLSIRLSRVGKKKMPTYRLIVTEKTRDPWGTYLEALGTLDPLAKPKKIDFDVERIKHWMSKGAQPSATVRNLLIDMKVLEGDKVKAHPTHKIVEEKK